VEVCFTKEELSNLTKKAKKSRLSVGGFIRLAVSNVEIKEAPPADVPLLIREVRRVGYNIEQLLKLANAKGLLDVPRLREALEENRAAEKLITETYTMAAE
jgi:hypothetical protein